MNFKETAKRWEPRSLTEANDFLMKRVSAAVLKLEKQYQIIWDGKTPTNPEDEMVDRLWQAGRGLLVSSGIFRMNSMRIIELIVEEIDEALRFTPAELPMGQGKDAVHTHHRQVEDPRKPFVFRGPFNADSSEEHFVKLSAAFAQEQLTDSLLFPGYLKKFDGRMITPPQGRLTKPPWF
jgi:hypothetical protein